LALKIGKIKIIECPVLTMRIEYKTDNEYNQSKISLLNIK